MNWLFPGFLAGAAVIALPVVLHWLRRKPRDVVRFPSLRFLGESALRDTRRNQLLRLLTLLLRCLAIALLCAAFARPFWGKTPPATRRALVIALDNSMSQQARGRWEATQRWSLDQLGELGPGDQAALLVMEPEPTWLVPMTDDLARVRAALAAARPGYDKTRYAPPLRLAGDTLAGTAAGTKILAWAADEQLAGWRGADLAEKLPPGIIFRFMGIMPAPQRQAAIISAHPSITTSNSLDVIVRQFEPATPDRRQFTVRAGDRVLATQSIVLHPGDNNLTIACDWPDAAAGLRVSMDADDLPADDSAWIAATTTATNRVLLDAATDTDFLAHALRATQKIQGAAFEPVTLPDHAWPLDAVVVLRNDASFRDAALARLNQFREAGGAVWIFVDGSVAQKDWLQHQGIRVTARLAADEPWHLRDWDPEHPALAAFAGQSLLPLLDVEFYRGFDLAGDALAPIANWPDGKMAIAELDSGGQRWLLAGFPLTRAATDWPMQPSFVPFVHCAVRWLGAFKDKRTDWRVGDTIPLSDNTGVWRALDTPAPQKDLAVAGSVRPTMPGLYEFSGNGVKQVFAVNTPVEESDLSPWPNPNRLAALESPASAPAGVRIAAMPLTAWAAAENRQRLWWWLLAIGGCALLAELAMANRTSR
ncbi:MAG: BatA domain-containing protein [Limisphaerales bacterium]